MPNFYVWAILMYVCWDYFIMKITVIHNNNLLIEVKQ